MVKSAKFMCCCFFLIDLNLYVRFGVLISIEILIRHTYRGVFFLKKKHFDVSPVLNNSIRFAISIPLSSLWINKMAWDECDLHIIVDVIVQEKRQTTSSHIYRYQIQLKLGRCHSKDDMQKSYAMKFSSR